MKKYLTTILILTIFLTPFISRADLPIWEDDGGIGTGSGGPSSGGNTGSGTPTISSSGSNLSVDTVKASDITQNSATLYGEGGYKSLTSSSGGIWGSIDGGKNGTWSSGGESGTWTVVSQAGGTAGVGTAYWTGTKGDGTGTWSNGSGLVSGTWTNGKGTGGIGSGTWVSTSRIATQLPPITAYFRYTKAKNNPPIFCNDIYGSNMIATGDIKLGVISLKSFSKQITGLSPNTTYYYCAIISNKDTIAYGGESIGGSSVVKQFHTNCYETTVETKSPATSIKSTSATLKGSYCSPKQNFEKTITNETVTVYFEYREAPIAGSGKVAQFTVVPNSEQKYSMGTHTNIYGDIKSNLSGLTPNTKYQFRAMVKNNAGMESETIYPLTPTVVEFKTNPSSGRGGTSGCTGSGCPDNKTLTCRTPYILNETKTACVYITDNEKTKTCANGANNYPTCTEFEINCVPPQFLDTTTTPDSCVNPTSCTAPEVYYPPTNSCVIQPICNPPEVLDLITNKCITAPAPEFCEANPTDSSCLPGPGWIWDTGTGTWTGGNWAGGKWTGGKWVDGKWFGGSWSSGTGSGGTSGNWNTGNFSEKDWSNTSLGTGTWSNGIWQNGTWSGGKWQGELKLGQTAVPPVDAIVRYHEGIETVFTRQILANSSFAKLYGYQDGTSLQIFAEDLSHLFAKTFGYIDQNGKEIRVSPPDIAAYQLQLIGNKLTIYEYYDNKIVDIRNMTTVFKDKSNYEYYFKKN